MSKKSKHAKGTPFSIDVCDGIRHHIGELASLASKRKNAFEDRDAALADKRGLRNKDSKEYAEASRRHSDAVIAIDELDDQIAWHRGQLKEVVEEADNPQHELEFEPPKPPPAEDPKQMKIGEGVSKDAPPVGRPVGRPAKETEPAVAVGENQHLLARVIELDMREDLKTACIDAGLGTIGAVFEVIKTDTSEATNLSTKLNIDGSAARQLRAAVEKYLKKHTRAEMDVERSGDSPAPDDRAKHGKGAGKSKRK